MFQKIDIDFSVYSNAYFLKVADYSTWGAIEAKPSIVEITFPGDKTPVTKFFDKYKTNVFNSITLELNCVGDCGDVEKVTLPDGVYTIKVTGSPSKFNKEIKYLKTDLFDMEVDKIFINSYEKLNRKDLLDKLTEVELLVKGAEAHLRFDNIKMARMLFEQAVKMVDDLNNCEECNK